MNAFRCPSAVALLFLAVGSSCPAFAQATAEQIRSSHDIQRLSFPSGVSEADLFQRLQNQDLANMLGKSGMLRPGDLDRLSQQPDLLMDLLKKHLGAKEAEAVKERPELFKMAYDAVKNGEGFPKDADVRPEEVKDALKSLQEREHEAAQRDQIPLPQTPVAGEPTNPGQAANDGANRNNGGPGARSTPKVGRQQDVEPEPPAMPQDKPPGWAERLQSLSPQLRNSPALQRAVQSLSKSVGTEDPKWRKLFETGKGLRERLGDWGVSAKLERFWPAEHFIPNVPQIDPRDAVRAADAFGGNWEGPQLGSPEVSGGRIVTVLAWLVAIVVGGICLRHLWLRLEEANRETRRKQALQRAWPVDPAGVNSREELIRAYEYLALSRLGIVVKSWNHLAIAARLGDSPDPLRRNAALSLTDAYEHARYAPLEESLPGEVIAEARRHLSLLAGATGS